MQRRAGFEAQGVTRDEWSVNAVAQPKFQWTGLLGAVSTGEENVDGFLIVRASKGMSGKP